MKKINPGLIVLTAVFVFLNGCVTVIGRGKGPLDSFVFLASGNPELSNDVIGIISSRTDPATVQLVVPPGTDKRKLVATLSLNAEATIKVVSKGDSEKQNNGKTSNNFEVPVTYSIEVSDQDEPWLYRVVVREADTNARLSQISVVEGGDLKPKFDPKQNSYQVEVPFATREIHFEARGQSRFLKRISIDGQVSRGAAGSAEVDFIRDEQEREVAIVTVAEDGETGEEYAITVRRGAPDSNSALSRLVVRDADLDPSFSSKRHNYRAEVPFAAKRIILQAKPDSSFATVSVRVISVDGRASSEASDGKESSGQGDISIPFPSGEHLSLKMDVKAQDGSVQEYLLEVGRAEPERNSRLTALTVRGGSLSPGFSPGRRSYIVDVFYSARRLTVLAKPDGKFARVRLADGPTVVRGQPAEKDGVVIDLTSDDQIPLVLEVTAQDGSNQAYRMDVVRAAPDANSDLESLTTSSGRLNPAFSPKTASYSLDLPADAGRIRLNLATASRYAGVKVLNDDLRVSGSPREITVSIDKNISTDVTAEVTAEDGSQRLYRVSVRRASEPKAAAPAPVQPSGTPAGTPPGTSGVAPDSDASGRPAAEKTSGSQPEEAAPPAGKKPDDKKQDDKKPEPPKPEKEKPEKPEAGRETSPESVSPPAAIIRQAGDDVVIVQTKRLKLGKREADGLAKNKDEITNQAKISVRYYRTDDLVARATAPVRVRKQGKTWTIDIDYSSEGMSLDRDRLVEIEVTIPTKKNRFLHYTEAISSSDRVEISPPFFLYGADPRVAWPPVGDTVKVAGYVSLPPPGKVAGESAADREDFPKNNKGEFGITVEITNPKSGGVIARQQVWRKPGLARGRPLGFEKIIELPEGMMIGYLMTAKARNGRVWSASGVTTVWTTKLRYEGGFESPVLTIVDDLEPGAVEPRDEPAAAEPEKDDGADDAKEQPKDKGKGKDKKK